jgi:hypothetical protein
VVRAQFAAAGRFCDGLACVRTDIFWGYIDRSATQVISMQFEVAGDFSETIAYARTEAKKPRQEELLQVAACEEMEKRIFKDDKLVEVSEELICVRVNLREFDKDLAKKYKVKAAPSVIIFDCTGEKMGRVDDPNTDIIQLIIQMREMIAKSAEKAKE